MPKVSIEIASSRFEDMKDVVRALQETDDLEGKSDLKGELFNEYIKRAQLFKDVYAKYSIEGDEIKIQF